MYKNLSIKIHVLHKYFAPVAAGIETNMLQTYGRLAKQGWDITVHTSRNTLSQINVLPAEEMIDAIKVRRYGFGPFGFAAQIDWKNIDALCLHNFDIFPHFQIMCRVLILKLIGKKTFAFFITPHGGFNPEWSVFPPMQRYIKLIYTYTLGVLLLNLTADGIRAVSEWEADAMRKRFVISSKIKVISNGVEDEAFFDVERLASTKIKEIVAKIGPYVFSNGRFMPIKNIETSIRAIAQIPNINLVHIGEVHDPNYFDFLKQLVKDLHLEDRVHFLGVVRGIDKYYLYKHAQVFVHPSLWEANANVIHEAWSQGVITIVGDNSGMRRVRDRIDGFRVDSFNVAALVEKIQFVLANPELKLLEEIKKNSFKYVESHSWEQVAMRMKEFYLQKISKYTRVKEELIYEHV